MSLKRRNDSDGRNGCVKIWEPQPLRIAKISTFLSLDPQSVVIKVPTPDARVQVKIALYAASDISSPSAVPPSIPFDVTDGGVLSVSLWLNSREIDEGTGLHIPVTDLVGTFGTPQALPLNAGLMGYSETVLQDVDSVWGLITFACAGAGVLNLSEDWWLQTRYSPVVEMCESEWRELIQYFTPEVMEPLISNNL